MTNSDPDSSTNGEQGPLQGLPVDPNYSLRNYWGCFVGAISIVAALFLIPWGAVGNLASVGAEWMGGVPEVVFVTPVALMGMAWKPVLAVSLTILIFSICFYLKTSRIRTPHDLPIAILFFVAFTCLFLLGFSFLTDGGRTQATAKIFTDSTNLSYAAIHRLTDKEIREVIRIDKTAGTWDVNRQELKDLFAPENRDEGFTDWNYDYLTTTIALITSDVTRGMFYSHCRRTEKAYQSAPAALQSRYSLTIEGKRVTAKSASACRISQFNGVNLSFARLDDILSKK